MSSLRLAIERQPSILREKLFWLANANRLARQCRSHRDRALQGRPFRLLKSASIVLQEFRSSSLADLNRHDDDRQSHRGGDGLNRASVQMDGRVPVQNDPSILNQCENVRNTIQPDLQAKQERESDIRFVEASVFVSATFNG